MKTGQMSRKLDKLGVTCDTPGELQQSVGGETTQESHPHQFTKNALGLNELREVFSPRDFKRIRLANKRNSVPFTNA